MMAEMTIFYVAGQRQMACDLMFPREDDILNKFRILDRSADVTWCCNNASLENDNSVLTFCLIIWILQYNCTVKN